MWSQCGLAEEVEGEFILGEELVPELVGKGGVGTGKDSKEVVFEGVDGLFGGIAAMEIWGSSC